MGQLLGELVASSNGHPHYDVLSLWQLAQDLYANREVSLNFTDLQMLQTLVQQGKAPVMLRAQLIETLSLMARKTQSAVTPARSSLLMTLGKTS